MSDVSGIEPRRRPSAINAFGPGVSAGQVYVWDGTAWVLERITHRVELGGLGPDAGGFGFGMSLWSPANFIGLYSRAFAFSIGSQDLVGGYFADQDEDILQIQVAADAAPFTDAHVNVWSKPVGGVWAATGHQILVPAAATRGVLVATISLAAGERLCFELDAADDAWSLGQAGLLITGLRAKRY